MGYGFMAYAIDLDALKAIVGSGKQPALDEALADFGNEAAGIDALLESHSDETTPCRRRATPCDSSSWASVSMIESASRTPTA